MAGKLAIFCCGNWSFLRAVCRPIAKDWRRLYEQRGMIALALKMLDPIKTRRLGWRTSGLEACVICMTTPLRRQRYRT